MINVRCRIVFVTFLICGLFSPSLLQSQQLFNDRSLELAASAGLSGGLGSVDKFTDFTLLSADLRRLTNGTVSFASESNTHWNFGVSGGLAVTSALMLTGELVRTRLNNANLAISAPSPIRSLSFDASVVELTGGVNYQFPYRDTNIAPYVAAGIGYARSTTSLQESPFDVLDLNLSTNHLTVNFGGGARIYVSPRWGFRPELKVVHVANETWFRVAGGIFFQFAGQ